MQNGRLAQRLARSRIPESDGLVPAAGGQLCAIRTEGDDVSGAGTTLERHRTPVSERLTNRLTRLGIPEPHRIVGAGRSQELPVGAERHAVDVPRMTP